MTTLPAFLQGGGGMGALTRTFNWQHTSLGPPQHWPPSLRATLGLLLHSPIPMCLFWGPNRLCFYNDAFRPLLDGSASYPALGQQASDGLLKQRGLDAASIGRVMQTGESIQTDPQSIITRTNEQVISARSTFSYSPTFDDMGQVGGVLVTGDDPVDTRLAPVRTTFSESGTRRIDWHYRAAG